MGKRVGKYLWRTQPIGVCKGRAADMPGAKMVVEMGIGIPSCGNRAQTAGRRQLGENHRCQLRPGRHCLDVSVAVVATDDGVEYASFHRFEKFIEDAIVVAHVQPHFPCLTTRKCTASRRSCWTSTATNRIFPGQYCACAGMTEVAQVPTPAIPDLIALATELFRPRLSSPRGPSIAAASSCLAHCVGRWRTSVWRSRNPEISSSGLSRANRQTR